MKVRRIKSYVCVDCDYAEHSRLQNTRDVDAAAGTWLRCLAHTRAQEEDGVVNAGWARRAFRDHFDRIEELVAVGLLLVRDDGDYEIRAYAPRNQTRAMLDSARTSARERMDQHRSARASDGEGAAAKAPKTRKPRAAQATGEASARRTNAEHTANEQGTNAFVPSSPSSSSSLSSSPLSRETEEGTERGFQEERAREPLPASERGMSGPLWLKAFTDGVTDHTRRPCTAGRVYLATLERVVTHHAPGRDAPTACTWLRAEARAFAAQWDQHQPPKGLTPDGLERWLNEGRPAPIEFGRKRIVQPPAEEWHPDDWSDLGAKVVQ
jgi:hypothetical protein